MKTLDDLENELNEAIYKVLLEFRYSKDQSEIFTNLVNETLRQRIISDLEDLCDENTRSYDDPKIFRVRESKIKQKIDFYRNFTVI